MNEWFPEELEAAKPPEKLTISEWACKYRELGKLSAISGLYSLDITPFFGPVMDRCSSVSIDEQYLCAPAQIGKTVALVENVTAYYLHQDPSSIMVCLADEDTAEFVAVEKIAAIFKDSAALAHLYSKQKFNRDVIDTANGGHVDFAWASSVAKLASRPERVVIGDEVNKPGYSRKTKEASSLSLLKERTKSYPDGHYKHIFLSTPTDEDGNITVLLASADVVIDWRVPCPYCGQLQPLRWSEKYCHGFKEYTYTGDDGKFHKFGMVVWEGGRKATRDQINETAKYQCGECGELWSTDQKNEAVRNGVEVTRDGRIIHKIGDLHRNERRIGNHINRLYSTVDSGKLGKLVQEWVDIFKLPGEKQVGALQGFVNSALAEPFKQVIELVTSNETQIKQAKCDLKPQTVPPEAVALTAFVDVQKSGFWFTVRAFAQNSTSWLVHYGYLPTWDDVGHLLFETSYPVNDRSNRRLSIWRAAVDTGGGEKYENLSMTEETYFWIRNNMGRGCYLWGTKGSSSPLPGKIRVTKPLDSTPSGKSLPGGLQIIQLNTDMLKDAFHYRLGQAIKGGDQAAYLHSETDQTYINHILAEEKQKNDKGLDTWVKVKKRNDLFDCEVGCLALASPEWPGGGVNLCVGQNKVDNETVHVHNNSYIHKKPNTGYQRPAWMT